MEIKIYPLSFETLTTIRGRGFIMSMGTKKSGGRPPTHGMSKHPLWRVWHDIKSICRNTNSRAYRWYGAKGIDICFEWESCEVFLKWCLENGWKRGLKINRIDERMNFCPENCRFITQSEIIFRQRSTWKNVGKIFGTWKIM